MPGRARVTSMDIAREAEVSQPTVSRALRGDPRVAPETVAAVEAAAARLGYVPDAAARSLTTGRSGTVAIVVSDLNNPFYPQLVQAVGAELGRARVRSLLLTDAGGVGHGGLSTLMRSGVVDGAILATATVDEATRSLLESEQSPIALVVRDVPGSGRDAVVADNRGGAAAAAALLARLGHRRVATISGPDNTSTARERDRGFREGAAAAGLELDPALARRGEYSHESGRGLCQDLLEADDPPTAIFAGNDVIALGALDAAARSSVAVPGTLSLIGFDDMEISGWAPIDLTTVHQPLGEMAAAAARLLLDRIAGDDGPTQSLVFSTELRERSTTGLAPGL